MLVTEVVHNNGVFVVSKEPLLRIPIHQVAAVSYIKEDDQHILAIKFGKCVNTML